MVYVIGDPTSNGPVKIGVTTDPPARLAAIRSGRGAIVPNNVRLAALQILAQHPGDRLLERDLHRHYANRRLVGEWFDLHPASAEEFVHAYRSDTSSAYATEARGTNCDCFVCLGHPPEEAPGDRPELANPDHALIATISAITNARLGVCLADSWVGLPASHCDIDRAVRLIRVLDAEKRSAALRRT